MMPGMTKVAAILLLFAVLQTACTVVQKIIDPVKKERKSKAEEARTRPKTRYFK